MLRSDTWRRRHSSVSSTCSPCVVPRHHYRTDPFVPAPAAVGPLQPRALALVWRNLRASQAAEKVCTGQEGRTSGASNARCGEAARRIFNQFTARLKSCPDNKARVFPQPVQPDRLNVQMSPHTRLFAPEIQESRPWSLSRTEVPSPNTGCPRRTGYTPRSLALDQAGELVPKSPFLISRRHGVKELLQQAKASSRQDESYLSQLGPGFREKQPLTIRENRHERPLFHALFRTDKVQQCRGDVHRSTCCAHCC